MLRNPNFLYKSYHKCKDYLIFFTYGIFLHVLAANVDIYKCFISGYIKLIIFQWNKCLFFYLFLTSCSQCINKATIFIVV